MSDNYRIKIIRVDSQDRVMTSIYSILEDNFGTAVNRVLKNEDILNTETNVESITIKTK